VLDELPHPEPQIVRQGLPGICGTPLRITPPASLFGPADGVGAAPVPLRRADTVAERSLPCHSGMSGVEHPERVHEGVSRAAGRPARSASHGGEAGRAPASGRTAEGAHDGGGRTLTRGSARRRRVASPDAVRCGP